MEINKIFLNSPYFIRRKKPQNTEGSSGATPVWATPEKPDSVQISTINKALDELSRVEFLPNDLIYMQNLGIKLPFNSGKEAVDWIKNSNTEVLYADFSNPKVHACLHWDEKNGKSLIMINSNYKNNCSFADVLAISEAILHECGHGKDKDSENSIQEELNCMGLNVLAHRFYRQKYRDIFTGHNSFLFSQGVSLYPKLFFNFSLTPLKERIAEKYGYLQTGDEKHCATSLANDIKDIYKKATFV